MAEKRKQSGYQNKCSLCQAVQRKNPYSVNRIIRSEQDVQNAFQLFNKTVNINDTICRSCYFELDEKLNLEKKRNKKIELSYPSTVESSECCFICSSTTKDLKTIPFKARFQVFSKKSIFIPEANQCCANHLICDQLYENDIERIRIISDKCKFTKDDLVKFMLEKSSISNRSTMGFKSTVETEQNCFICLSTMNLVAISLEARLDVFSRKEIFIPKGNRCCSHHLINDRLDEDGMNEIKIVSSTCQIDDDEFIPFVMSPHDH